MFVFAELAIRPVLPLTGCSCGKMQRKHRIKYGAAKGMRKRVTMGLRLKIVSAIAALLLAAPSEAQDTAVDLALILAVDVSMSIDEGEAGVQRIGYIHALRDERVAEAIRSGPIGRIAITYMEWSSIYSINAWWFRGALFLIWKVPVLLPPSWTMRP